MKNLPQYITEYLIKKKVDKVRGNNSKIDYEQLRSDAESRFSDWIETSDNKRKEIRDIKKFINDKNDLAYDEILNQLEEDEYDRNELENDENAIQAIKDGAQDAIDNA